MTGMETFLMWVIAPLISAIAAGFGGWFFGRKKQQIETIDAANTTFNNIINNLELQVNKLLVKNEELTTQIEKLTSEVRTLRDEIETLRGHAKENEKLKRTNVRYEKLLDSNCIDY